MIEKTLSKIELEAYQMVKDYSNKILKILNKNIKRLNSRKRVLIRLNLNKISTIVEMMENITMVQTDFFQTLDEDHPRMKSLNEVSVLIKSSKDEISESNSKYLDFSANIFGNLKIFGSAYRGAWNDMLLIFRIIRCS
jgi:aspartokinase